MYFWNVLLEFMGSFFEVKHCKNPLRSLTLHSLIRKFIVPDAIL